jgi:hypothetical protein
MPGTSWSSSTLRKVPCAVLDALRCLSRWPDECITSEQRDAVAQVAARDPDPEVRADAERVLRGESIEPPEFDVTEPEE